MIHLWRDLPVLLAAAPQTAFLLIYSLPSLGAGQWWRDFTGRALFLKALTLALLIDFAALGTVGQLLRGQPIRYGWPEHGINACVVIGYWLVMAAIVYQLVALLVVRRRARRRR